jgi:hypothetical protein
MLRVNTHGKVLTDIQRDYNYASYYIFTLSNLYK